MRRIQNYFAKMAAGRAGAERVDCFLALFDDADSNPFRNYAIAVDECKSVLAVRALVDAFATRNRRPRLELIPQNAPALVEYLIAEGFQAEGSLPVMICTAKDLIRQETSDFAISLATTEAQLREAAQVQNAAYGEGPATPADLARLQRTVAAGGAVVLARSLEEGSPAGSGLFPTAYDGVTEIAAIGVLERFRRRGLAAAMTTWLTELAFQRGIDLPFLTPGHAAEERIYARCGYRRCCEVLHISIPAPAV